MRYIIKVEEIKTYDFRSTIGGYIKGDKSGEYRIIHLATDQTFKITMKNGISHKGHIVTESCANDDYCENKFCFETEKRCLVLNKNKVLTAEVIYFERTT
jgi:hypothetical protein